jgi:hypothetical protein
MDVEFLLSISNDYSDFSYVHQTNRGNTDTYRIATKTTLNRNKKGPPVTTGRPRMIGP